MQKAYIMALCELAQKDKNVLSVLADSGSGYDELFRRYYPEQMLDFGIAEENTVGAAAGLAMCGKIPFVFTNGSFLAYRCYEFIRDDVCFQNLNVKFIGIGAGISLSTLGVTHHTTEDLAALRALPNLTIFSPSCPREVEMAVKAAYEIKGPVYIKIGMNNEPDIYGEKYAGKVSGSRSLVKEEFSSETYRFCPGKNVELRAGADVCIFTTGSIAADVLDAADVLAEQGTDAGVVNIHTIRPFDEANILACADRYPILVSVEEHSITGGIGSAIAEVLAEHNKHVAFRRIGLPNRFAEGYGTHAQVKAANALDAEGISRQILDLIRETKERAEETDSSRIL